MTAELPIRIGQLIGGKYRVEASIGRGGMGAVFRATHVQLMKPVALKVLLPNVLDALPDAVQRFLREARAAARLTSEHVAKVLDVDAEGSSPYMAMEFLDGYDLSKPLKQGEHFSVADSIAYALDVCEALIEAHALGIVHRDLKPQNMFLTRRADGRAIVKVLDFGISKLVGPGVSSESSGGMNLTGTQVVLGSPTYMSPEQMLATKSVDARTDIWALGVCVYEFLTGAVPFSAPTQFELGAKVLTQPPTPPRAVVPDLPVELEAIVLRCLEKDPALRFGSVAELAAALRDFAASTGAIPSPTFRDPRAAHASAPFDPSAKGQTTPLGVGTGFAPTVDVTPAGSPRAAVVRSAPPATPVPAAPLPPLYGMQVVPQDASGQTGAAWVDRSTGAQPKSGRALLVFVAAMSIVCAAAVVALIKTSGSRAAHPTAGSPDTASTAAAGAPPPIATPAIPPIPATAPAVDPQTPPVPPASASAPVATATRPPKPTPTSRPVPTAKRPPPPAGPPPAVPPPPALPDER